MKTLSSLAEAICAASLTYFISDALFKAYPAWFAVLLSTWVALASIGSARDVRGIWR
jgi:hypothetical protein